MKKINLDTPEGRRIKKEALELREKYSQDTLGELVYRVCGATYVYDYEDGYDETVYPCPHENTVMEDFSPCGYGGGGLCLDCGSSYDFDNPEKSEVGFLFPSQEEQEEEEIEEVEEWDIDSDDIPL